MPVAASAKTAINVAPSENGPLRLSAIAPFTAEVCKAPVRDIGSAGAALIQ
jgi:hypothetical protein